MVFFDENQLKRIYDTAQLQVGLLYVAWGSIPR